MHASLVWLSFASPIGSIAQHPGGRKIILKNSGKDVSEIWWNYHSETIFKKTAQKFRIGDGESRLHQLPPLPSHWLFYPSFLTRVFFSSLCLTYSRNSQERRQALACPVVKPFVTPCPPFQITSAPGTCITFPCDCVLMDVLRYYDENAPLVCFWYGHGGDEAWA